MAIEANSAAQTLCKEDKEAMKSLEQQHLKLIYYFVKWKDPPETRKPPKKNKATLESNSKVSDHFIYFTFHQQLFN